MARRSLPSEKGFPMLKSSALPTPRSLLRRIGHAALALVLVVGLFPSTTAFAETESAAPATGLTDAQLDAMLDGQNYVEGQVIAVVRADLVEQAKASDFHWPWEQATDGADLLQDAQVLMQASLEAAGMAADEELADASSMAALSTDLVEVDTDEDSAVSIVLVTSTDLSTRQLLTELSAYDLVISVEPDYVSTVSEDDSSLTAEELQQLEAYLGTAAADDQAATEDAAATANATATQDATATANAAATTTAATADSAALDALQSPTVRGVAALSDSQVTYPNLLSTQWYTKNNSTYGADKALLRTNATHVTDFDLGLGSDWNNPNMENAAGVVAILDTGIDYTNPDLDDVMIHLTAEQNAGTKGGEYGYAPAATAEENPSDPMDVMGHGTHCAGIVAAEWNDFGTSGVANGVQLLGVRAGTAKGTLTHSALLDGYNYLSTIMDNGVNIVAVNDSWGADFVKSSALNVAMYQLGQKGAISLLAAGNSNLDTDRTFSSGTTSADNPYVVTVSSAQYDATRSTFSNYGQYTSDVYGTGSEIMATWPASLGTYYQPVADANCVGYSNFATESSVGTAGAVRFMTTSDDIITEVLDGTAELPKTETDIEDADYAVYSADATVDSGTGSLKLKSNGERISISGLAFIPVEKDKVASLKYFGVNTFYAGTSASKSATPVVVLPVWQKSDGSIGTGVSSPATISAKGDAEWRTSAYNLEQQRPTKSDGTPDQGATLYTIPTSDEGMVYAVLAVAVVDITSTVSGLSLADFYFDDFGFGTEGTAWTLIQGTSMATPSIAGAAAVVAKRQVDDGQSLSGAESALYRANYLRSHILTMEGYEDTCRQGGLVNLAVAETDTTPVISKVSQGSDRQITLTGDYFGQTAGSVQAAGVDCEVATWTNTEIVVTVPESVASGDVTVAVTAANGKTGRSKLAYVANDVTVFPRVYQNIMADTGCEANSGVYATAVGLISARMVSTQDAIYALAPVLLDSSAVYGLYRFDLALNQWAKMDFTLPSDAELIDASMAVVGDKLYVATTESGDTALVVRLYEYDTTTGALKTIDASAINELHSGIWASLVAYDDTLLLIGGTNESGTQLTEDNILQLTIADGKAQAKTVGSFYAVNKKAMTEESAKQGVASPQTVVFDGQIYVAGGCSGTVGSAMLASSALTRLTKGTDGTWTCEDLTDALPEGLSDDATYAQPSFGLTATSEGVFLVGATVLDADGNRVIQDTYILEKGASAFKAWGKTFNVGSSIFTVACSQGDALYAMAQDKYQSDGGVYFACSSDLKYTRGDANNNDAVNIVDAQIVSDMANGKWTSEGSTVPYDQLVTQLSWDRLDLEAAADANQDNAVDAADAFAIQHYAVTGSWE